MTREQALLAALDTLKGIDFAFAEQADEVTRKWMIEDLERAVDIISAVWRPCPLGEKAIEHFLTDPARSRVYLYGPTDIGSGVGLIAQLDVYLGAQS